jgi:hypothetical protein
MRLIISLILMIGFFVFFGAVSPIMGGGTDSKAQSQFEKPLWGTDNTVATGSVENGISIDQDTAGNLYAVRCSTYNGVENAWIKIYKSTDGGANWFSIANWLSGTENSYSYPVILTGSAGNKLYVFYLYSANNGDLKVNRRTPSGIADGQFNVLPYGAGFSDTITYFSACTDYGQGNYLMVAYQKEETGDATPDIYTIVSTDSGASWDYPVKVSEDGAHPDIAYGQDGYVYLVYESTLGWADHEIMFYRSRNYCASGSWEYLDTLTNDTFDDTYPKVAALHKTPANSPCVWVTYNHDYAGTGYMDLRYAYSTNGGVDWSKNRVLASSSDTNEMACDLWVKRSTVNNIVSTCYLKYKWYVMNPYSRIFYTWASSSNPENWSTPTQISGHRAGDLSDSRKICQGSFTGAERCILYVGNGLQDLYFDNIAWTDVGDEEQEEESPATFSLSPNYPNPFNPVTTIGFKVKGGRSKVPVPTTLKVYNVLGQLVRTLVNEPKERGTYEVIWDGKDDEGKEVASGIYLYQLKAGEFAECKKMVLLK